MKRGVYDYVVICGCGYCTAWRTLGQAAADLTRHSDDNPGHSPTAQRGPAPERLPLRAGSVAEE